MSSMQSSCSCQVSGWNKFMTHMSESMRRNTMGSKNSMRKIMRNSMPQPKISMKVPSAKMPMKAAPRDRRSSMKAWKTRRKTTERTS